MSPTQSWYRHEFYRRRLEAEKGIPMWISMSDEELESMVDWMREPLFFLREQPWLDFDDDDSEDEDDP